MLLLALPLDYTKKLFLSRMSAVMGESSHSSVNQHTKAVAGQPPISSTWQLHFCVSFVVCACETGSQVLTVGGHSPHAPPQEVVRALPPRRSPLVSPLLAEWPPSGLLKSHSPAVAWKPADEKLNRCGITETLVLAAGVPQLIPLVII